MQKLFKLISLILDDVLLLAGVFFIAYGVYSIYVPAGHITTGLAFLAIAYIVAKRKDLT